VMFRRSDANHYALATDNNDADDVRRRTLVRFTQLGRGGGTSCPPVPILTKGFKPASVNTLLGEPLNIFAFASLAQAAAARKYPKYSASAPFAPMQRHVPWSIATIRFRLAGMIAHTLGLNMVGGRGARKTA
jgi:hypothetical protein